MSIVLGAKQVTVFIEFYNARQNRIFSLKQFPIASVIEAAVRVGICVQTVPMVAMVRPLTSLHQSSPPPGPSAPLSSGTI